jgi:translation initiation factor IF-2
MEKNIVRPPVVVVVGHVDHGKTSLLDAIRKTSETRHEAGGITQSIGASIAKTSTGSEITFIDTPGHALFANMRSRGIILADIGILVVAADDGVQPQTKEAIRLLQESKLPFVVAITKIDMATANVENALQTLEKEGVYFEKRGGDVSYIPVSSKTGEGVKELLDLIGLVAEINEIKGNSEGELEGYVIETSKDKRGLMVSVIVKNGTIKVADTIYAGELKTKVKGIFDSALRPQKEVNAGYPAQILGFDQVPETGSPITSIPTKLPEKKLQQNVNKDAQIKVFIKAKTAGSLEALLANIPEEVQIIGSGVGDVTESDIFLAKAGGALVFLFEAKYSSGIRKLAEMEGVKIEKYEVVYDLIEKLKDIIKSGLEEVTGQAQIQGSFPFNNKKVAGCKIIQGKILKGATLKLMRGEKELGKVKVLSIRKQKDEVSSVGQGEECGILFAPQLDFQALDVLLSVTN